MLDTEYALVSCFALLILGRGGYGRECVIAVSGDFWFSRDAEKLLCPLTWVGPGPMAAEATDPICPVRMGIACATAAGRRAPWASI